MPQRHGKGRKSSLKHMAVCAFHLLPSIPCDHGGDSTQEEMTFLTTLEVATLKPAGHNCSLAKMWPKPVCCISTWQLCSGNSYTALHKFQVCCHCPTQVGSSRAPGLICFKSIHFLGSVLKISTLAHYHLLGILKKNHCFQ